MDIESTKPKSSSIQQIDHERLTSLINSMGDAVIAIDEKQKIVLYNGAALNILDRNTDMTTQYISTVINLVDKDNKPVDLSPIIQSVKIPYFNRDYRLLYPDKSSISLYLSIAPVKLGFGQKGMKGYVVMLRDITREKSLEEERDEFISVVSHELRTPIAITEGNIGNAQLIAEKTGDISKIKDALKQAHDQVLFLADMINDLSTLSRAERGRLKVELEQINVHDLMNDLTDNYRPEAEKKTLEIKLTLDPELSMLNSSRLYVREILQNFITNAIKYTQKGHISLSAKPQDEGILFTVRDTGIGIGTADQEKIFTKFFRSEDFRTRENSGTGLGLYVTAKLAKLIGAKITIESQLDKGSTFKIYIPNLK